MEYKVNANTTTTTSEEVNAYLKDVTMQTQITEYPVEISFDILLQKTASKLFHIFSKMYYDILKDNERLEILEYCLTLYSGVKRTNLTKILTVDDWDVLIVENKDRLTRFGFNYLKLLLNKQGKDIIVVN